MNKVLKTALTLLILPVVIVIGLVKLAIAAGTQPLRTWMANRIRAMSTQELKETEARLARTANNRWTHRQVKRELARRKKAAKAVKNGLSEAETVNIGLLS